jgi:hypothetical protein
MRSKAKAPARRAPAGAAAAESPARQLAGFIAKFDADVAKRIRGVRRELRRRLPTAFELVYDNYNFFVIGFGPTERASEAVVSLAADANGVALAFLHGATLPDPADLLRGAGKQNRFVRLPTAATVGEPAVEALLRAAVSQSPTPFPRAGRGPLVIKSVSAKQRPRRRQR